MKKKYAYLAMSLTMLLNLVALPAAVHAQADDMSTTVQSEATTTTTSDDTPEEVESDEVKAARPERIANYKKGLKQALTTAAKTRISDRCVAAQAMLKVKKSNNYSVHASRTEKYDKILTKLQELSAAASTKGVDVAVLQTNITELQAKIATFKTANTPYQQALTDLLEIDCKTDPVAFKAALEVARTNQTAVYDAAIAIRTYLKDTVKPTLTTIKTALESDQE